MWLSSSPSVIAFALNVTTLVTASSAVIVCLCVLARVAYRHRLRLQRNDYVVLLHCANTYIMLFSFAMSVTWLSVGTLLGDFGIATLDNSGLSWLCKLRAYCLAMFLLGIYFSFCLQAFYRLTRVVYSRFIWLKTVRFCLLSILLQWVLSALYAIVYMNRSVYNSADHCCFAPFNDLSFSISGMFTVYCIPISIIFFVYLRITHFLKRTLVIAHRKAARRDVLVVRRIALLISGLLVLASPTLVLWIMFMVTGNAHPLLYRLEFLANALVVVVFSGTTILITTRLKAVVLKKRYTYQMISVVTLVPNVAQRI